MSNGFSSAYVDVKRGVRKTGWSTIPLSFHYCSRNTGCIYVKRSNEIKGIIIRDEYEVKLTALADDMATFWKTTSLLKPSWKYWMTSDEVLGPEA